MKDIASITPGSDLNIQDTIVPKAGNVLSVQLGSLEYVPEFGVDLKYFLNSQIQFQNESFKTYLIQRLTESQVNVTEVFHVIESLYQEYTYYVGDMKPSTGGLIT